jgi:2-hydroxychromene-2-carboxylate isomerase
MAKLIDFYFTPVSPWTYLGMPRFAAMTAKHGVHVNYKPVDMVPLFASANVKPLKDRPEPLKRNRLNELRRWRELLGMTLNLQPKYFPTSAMPASRLIIAARQAGHEVGGLAEAILRACWAEERDVGDEATIVAIAAECGLDGAALQKAAQAAAVEAELKANTEEALGRFIWGSPSYYVDGELFFGQDRLPFLERKLAG